MAYVSKHICDFIWGNFKHAARLLKEGSERMKGKIHFPDFEQMGEICFISVGFPGIFLHLWYFLPPVVLAEVKQKHFITL